MTDGHQGRADGPKDHQACLDRAIAEHELTLAYQAELDVTVGRDPATDTVTAVEALCRWNHPVHGRLQPADFIPALEHWGLMPQLSKWVIDHAIGDYASWAAARNGLDVVLRINVSPAQLLDPSTTDQFAAALRTHGVAGSSVCVEITEHAPLGDLRPLVEAMVRLRTLGIACAIDDLASGYSTLGALRSLPVEVVKLDRSLIAGIDADPRARTIVAHVLRMAAELGATVVAEGVENERELDTVRDLGCTRAQGHYLSRPVDGPRMAKLLSGRGRRVRCGSTPPR